MSLETINRLYAGHEQPDVASLEADGNFYRCYVYFNRAEMQIDAVCERIQPNGTRVIVFHNTIAFATTTEITDTSGYPLDCPKIIARGTYFIVHWLQATSIAGTPRLHQWALYRASQNMELFNETAWLAHGSVAIERDRALYDVCPLIGTNEFVVARYSSAGSLAVERYDGIEWADIAWQTFPAHTLNVFGCLGVYAHEADNDVIVTYQEAGVIRSTQLIAGTGVLGATADTFVDIPAGWALQVGHCRVSENRVAVVCEIQPTTNAAYGDGINNPTNWIHIVAYRLINSSTCARVGNEHWATDLHMASRPFSYADGRFTAGVPSGTSDVYVMLTFRSVNAYDDWSQFAAFVCNLDAELWATHDSGSTVRPRPVSTIYTVGIPDCRASGWKPSTVYGGIAVHTHGPAKRSNQLSSASGAPPFGPDVKTRTIAMTMFAALRPQSIITDPDLAPDPVTNPYRSTLQPEQAGIRGLVFYIEDPGTVYRDDSDPAQPRTNLLAPYSRSMYQSVPAGNSLFVSGGTPQIYDGQRVVECGFAWRPEILSATNIIGDNVPAGTYYAYAMFSWTDKSGTIHRSAPSDIVEFTVAGGASSAISYRVRGISVSQKDSAAWVEDVQPIQVEIYRTLSTNVGGYYRVFGAGDDIYSSDTRPRDTPANTYFTTLTEANATDDLSDQQLEQHGTGAYGLDLTGALARPLPAAVPAFTAVAPYLNRIFGVDALDPTVIHYSDELIPDPGAAYYSVPVFDAEMFYRIGDIGEITAMMTMNNALIVFTRSSIWSLLATSAGTASNQGLMNVQAELLHNGTGCIEPRSLVLTPLGIMFQSAKGYYMLSRNRELGYYSLARSRDEAFSSSGSEVEDDLLEGGNIKSAVLLDDRPQVRVVTNGSATLTQTWTMAIGGGTSVGVWAFVGFVDANGAAIAVSSSLYAVNGAANAAAVATTMTGVVTALMLTSLRYIVASVTAVAGSVVIEMFPDLAYTMTGTHTGLGTVTPTLAELLTHRPRVLMYDYLLQKWSRFETPTASSIRVLGDNVGGASWHGNEGGSLHVVVSQSVISVEREAGDTNEYGDDSGAGSVVGVALDITTSWLSFAGLAGYIRVKSIGVQTRRHNPEAMSVDLEYDRSGSYAGDSLGIDIEPSTYTWNSPAPAYLRIRPREQKVAAVRVRVYEAYNPDPTQNVTIIGLVFEVGVKPGMKRVGDAQIGS